jgi:phosphatidylserine synthase
MKSPATLRSPWLVALSVVAIVFGLMTLVSGALTLFNAEVQRSAGNFVGFVLWFNFLAGLAYVVAGVGLWLRQRWAVWLSFAIAAATVFIFAAFGMQVWRGGSYEMRTVWAMAFRAVTWLVISTVAYAKLITTPLRLNA